MRRLVIGSAVVAGLLAVALLASAGFVVFTVRRSFPEYSGTVEVPGLTAPVEVLRDAHGVPQLYADTAEDLFYAQGWVHAQDRFWEMDFRRHITSGSLSELFGASQVETDSFVRTLGWRRVAAQELPLLAPSTRRYLRAYADGVNAWQAGRTGSELSLEHGILALTNRSYVPAPWSPLDSLSWLKAMAWDLRGNMQDEVARVLAAQPLPRDRVEQLYPPYPYQRHQPIVADPAPVPEPVRAGGGSARAAAAVVAPFRRLQRQLTALDALLGPGGHGIGSNAWAVSGRLTVSGKPLLANDPHLAPALPSTWTQVGLHCRTISRNCPYDVAGFSFSGLPGVVIGHNARVAWGFTNLGPDVSDLFLEDVRAQRYRTPDGTRPLSVRRETIPVAGGDDVTLVVRSTRHGPLVSDVSPELRDVGRTAAVTTAGATSGPSRGGGYAVALRWTALDPGRTADALFALDRASDWVSFRKAAQTFAVPAQNLVYADVDGHIGYQAPGDIPIRRSGDGRWPVPGWTGQFDWQGSIPFADLPWELDPPDGLVVTANQAVVPRRWPYLLTADWSYGYRSQRIRDVLTQAASDGRALAVADMSALQTDSLHPAADLLLPWLRSVPGLSGYRAQGQEVLRRWDGRQGAGSAGAAYFNSVWSRLLHLVFDDDIAADAARPDGDGRWVEVVRALLRRPADPFWDDTTTPQRETRESVLRQAMWEARDEVTRLSGKEPADWSWGRMHTLTLRNQSFGTSGIGPVEWLVNRGPYQLGGGADTVDATGWDARTGYRVDWVPSMRMVVDLGDLDASRWVNLTGQSGHPFDPHYTDQFELWRSGATLPMRWRADGIRETAADSLTLVPGGS